MSAQNRQPAYVRCVAITADLWFQNRMTARQPVIIGVGQLSNRAADPSEVMEPLEMMAEVARRAAADAGIGDRLREVDSLTVINIISRAYADPAALSRRAARHRRRATELYTSMGGNSPQWRVNETADRIARGEVRLALIAGAEAMHGLQMARRAGVKLDWAESRHPRRPSATNRWGNNDDRAAPPRADADQRLSRCSRTRCARSAAGRSSGIAPTSARCARAWRRSRSDNPYAWFRDGKTRGRDRRGRRPPTA